jgi:hypothetical protein
MTTSSEMSCQAMSELAKNEAIRNRDIMFYQTIHPVCERFQNLADREQEYDLQKPITFGKKACFTPTPSFRDGPWKDMFNVKTSDPVRFDIWSRRK